MTRGFLSTLALALIVPALASAVPGPLTVAPALAQVPFCAGPTRCQGGATPLCERGYCYNPNNKRAGVGCIRYVCPHTPFVPPKTTGPITTPPPASAACAARPTCPPGTILRCRRTGICALNAFTRPGQGCLAYECGRL